MLTNRQPQQPQQPQGQPPRPPAPRQAPAPAPKPGGFFQPQKAPAAKPQAPGRVANPFAGQRTKPQAPRAQVVNPFVGIGEARAGRTDKNNERTGDYIERVDGVTLATARSGLPYITIRKTVLAILQPAEDGATHYVGEEVQHLISYNLQYPSYFLEDVKGFIACVGAIEDADQITEEDCQEVCGETQPFAGFLVHVHNLFKTSQNNNVLTIVNYRRRVPSYEIATMLTEEQIAQFFPGDMLQQMAAAEEAAAQPAPQQTTDEQPQQ